GVVVIHPMTFTRVNGRGQEVERSPVEQLAVPLQGARWRPYGHNANGRVDLLDRTLVPLKPSHIVIDIIGLEILIRAKLLGFVAHGPYLDSVGFWMSILGAHATQGTVCRTIGVRRPFPRLFGGAAEVIRREVGLKTQFAG